MAFSSVQPIGDPPGMTPDESYPCAICKAKASGSLATAALESITDDDDFPVDALREFLTRYADTFKDMVVFLYDEGYDRAKRDDNDYCADHRPTKDDEE